jgi:hypothetical protein
MLIVGEGLDEDINREINVNWFAAEWPANGISAWISDGRGWK